MRIAAPNRVSLVAALCVGMWWAMPTESSAAGNWGAPLPEPLTVTRPFDPPEDPYGAGHRGVDLAGSPGQEVRAAGEGTVVYAGPLAGRGVVSVQHADGLRTTYEPVLTSVSAGLPVSVGQVLGSLAAGHAGCPVAACLHWGLKRAEFYLDPLMLLVQGPVRLLPRYGSAQTDQGFDPALAITAGSPAIGILGLSVWSLSRRRRHGTRPASNPDTASSRMRTKRQQRAAERALRAVRQPCRPVFRREGGPGGRPP